MKVLIAFPDSKTIENPFVRTLKNELEDIGCDVDMGLDKFWEFSYKYNIVHIQWPDSLFKNWNPSDLEVLFLKKQIEEIKKTTKIVYTRHNLIPHSKSINRSKCYEIVEENADAIVHMGSYGIERLKENMKNHRVKHYIIPHHLYEKEYDENTTQKEARKILNIPQNKFVILTFGRYRNAEEVHMVLSGFREYRNKHKYLLAPRLEKILFKKEEERKKWKRIKNKLVLLKFRMNGIHMDSDSVSDDYLPYYFAAADVVLIQRKVILNSGNIPMAFFFKKIVIGANVGNMGELLIKTNNIIFNPNKKGDVAKALFEAEKKLGEGIGDNNYNYARQYMNINSVAKQYLKVYQNMVD